MIDMKRGNTNIQQEDNILQEKNMMIPNHEENTHVLNHTVHLRLRVLEVEVEIRKNMIQEIQSKKKDFTSLLQTMVKCKGKESTLAVNKERHTVKNPIKNRKREVWHIMISRDLQATSHTNQESSTKKRQGSTRTDRATIVKERANSSLANSNTARDTKRNNQHIDLHKSTPNNPMTTNHTTKYNLSRDTQIR